MSIQILKFELIQWILLLNNVQVLNEIQELKEKSPQPTAVTNSRQFGCGKGIFSDVADDFDETPPGFEEYIM
ncbi:MAG: hypothetical protein JGK17_02145 [Microcoleus sp. PH2017_10_PVI_O_A]|uniref:hypothetical protein n=1 Tax=unclassified Microcoleus TaxID=2642155 RepID=UPI001DCE336E|nr:MULTISPECIES: hypothetical protein [unclassified Microcoleus]TAE82661.1 MAG: hypothetical protein EAZ83_11435 [Oscillatoriales cyanobacterium]MCC3404414.1 hypothetical protein [Microcoleus sp. PH2017_10_PVI_O_A]MCC3458502.1 hypothetical protein [Microcoleus sp. PH2017_11_PCY_U_A]MCC3477240.1 hypothetical protein [Microcoleus sp. PH2017_12_PCY_D_A]MCC3531779.1 hypothetical protein [Microcoleus sp. PH2017_21_RUC_O_A]